MSRPPRKLVADCGRTFSNEELIRTEMYLAAKYSVSLAPIDRDNDGQPDAEEMAEHGTLDPPPGQTNNIVSWTYSWDVENRLIGVATNENTVASYAYDYMSRRSQKIVGGVTNNFVWCANDQLMRPKS